MSNPKSSSKKRKRDHNQAIITVSSTENTMGPLLVVFPAIQPPPSVAFKPYSRSRSRSDSANNTNDIIIAGETDRVEFVTNEEESGRVTESGCRYIVALRNKRTGAISLHPSSNTPQILQRTVKALKSIKTADAPTTTHQQARTALGESFGTKKAKAAIRAKERNKVDVGAMEGVVDYVMEGIEKGAEGLMSTEEAKELADNNRLIPPFSSIATEPNDIYSLHGIIPENEWKALSSSINAFAEKTSDEERIALLPHTRSQWINAQMRIWGKPNPSKDRKKNLKLLLYISALFAFRNAVEKRDFNADQIRERLTALPGIVLDGLLSRFTEKARGSIIHQNTSTTKTLLLTNLFALCLKLDNFATNITMLSTDLNISTDQVSQLFRSLGCKVSVLSERERARLGLPNTGNLKYAVLIAPVEFPKLRQKQRK